MLLLLLAILTVGCSPVDTLKERGTDAASERLAERSKESLARLEGLRDTEINVLFSDAVTLGQLQQAGIPVGSHEIACEQPLHVVIMDGMFDPENLFDDGIPLHGHPEAALAMRLIAEIYNPETDMPMGMIGDSTGNHLNGLLRDSSIGSGEGSGELVLDTSGTENAGQLVPEAVCR